MKHVKNVEEYLNEGFSIEDKKALNRTIVDAINKASLAGHLEQISNAKIIDDTTIELKTEFENAYYKLVKVTSN